MAKSDNKGFWPRYADVAQIEPYKRMQPDNELPDYRDCGIPGGGGSMSIKQLHRSKFRCAQYGH
jgi:hypothetical protein